MDRVVIEEKIRNALKTSHFTSEDDLVDVSVGESGDSVELLIVSRKLDELGSEKSDKLIQSILERDLSADEQALISGYIAISPEEIKHML